MAKRALIAEPDEAEARKQAAILNEAGWNASIFEEGDLLGVIAQDPPDVVFLRHERRGQSGLALIGRIKKQRIAPGTALVLTTSDLASEAIEKHKKRGSSADHYIRLPLSRQDLVNAASAVPQVHEVDDIEAEVEVSKPSVGAPPPLPPKRRRGRIPASPGNVELTDEDIKFVDSVFKSIQHVNPEGASGANPVAKNLTGLDRKVAVLRKSLGDRERELARLSNLWRQREEQLRKAGEVFEQKDIEVEGLKLKVQELNKELDDSRQELADKISEFGKERRDSYDEGALREASLIQEVAKKENELNKLRRTLRKTEESAEQERNELTERIFEWERAYRQFETHHADVNQAGRRELDRLEAQIVSREDDKRALRDALHGREEQIARMRQLLDETRWMLFATSHVAREEQLALYREGDLLYFTERQARHEAEEDRAALSLRVFDTEEGWFRTHRLLAHRENAHAEDARSLTQMIVDAEADIVRLTAERKHFLSEASLLQRVLYEERALGQAAVHHLLTTSDRERLEARLQIPARDERIFELEADTERLSSQIEDLTARLSNEELEHATQRARADELDKTLADTERDARERIERLTTTLEETTAERDRLRQDLDRTENDLAETQQKLEETLTTLHDDRQRLGLELAQRQNELKDRAARLVEFERDLEVARTDLSAARDTVSARDDRISELLAKLRDADALTVRLESQTERLTTQVAELSADTAAKAEAIASLQQKLDEEGDANDALQLEKQKLQQTQAALEAEIERQRAEHEKLTGQLDALRDDKVAVEEAARTVRGELEAAREKQTRTDAVLAEARVQIDSGAALIEQLESQLEETETGRTQIRLELDQTKTTLGETQGELSRVRNLLEERQTTLANTEAELQSQRALGQDLGQRLAAETQRAKGAEGERDQAQNLIAGLEKELGQAGAKSRHLESTLQERDAAIAELRADLEALRDEKDTLQREKEAVQQEKATVQQEKERVVARAQELGVSLEVERQERADVDEQLKAERDRANRLADKSSALEEQARELQRQLSASESEVLNQNDALGQVRDAHTAAEQRASVAEQRVQELTADLDELRASLDDKQVEIEERKRWVSARDAKIRELEQKLTAQTQQGQEAQALDEEHRAQIARLTEQLSTERKETEQLQKKSREELAMVQIDLEQQRSDHQAVQQQLAALQQQLAQRQQQLDGLQNASSEAEHYRQQVQTLTQAEQAAQQKAAQAVQQLEEVKRRLTMSEQERHRLSEAVEQAESAAAERTSAKAHEEQAQRAQIEALQGRAAELEDKLKKAQGMLARSLTAHDAQKRRADELEISVQAQRTETEEAKTRVDGEVARLKATLQQKQKELRDAVSAAKQARAERDQIKALAERKIRELASRRG